MSASRKPMEMRSEVARPRIPSVDYNDEISQEQFEKLKSEVGALNDPARKRSIVGSAFDLPLAPCDEGE